MPKTLVAKCSLSAIACSISIFTYAASGARDNLDVPAGELVAALKALATQSNIELVYQPEHLRDIRTAGVKGVYSPQEAVAILLNGTALRVYTASSGAMVIVPALMDSAAADDAQNPTAKQENGQMRLTQAETSSAKPNSSPFGQDSQGKQNTSRDPQGEKLQEIIVTATRRAERVQDVPMSIAVVTADDIDRRGLVSAEDYLRGIPGVSQMTGSEGQNIVIRGIETTAQFQNWEGAATVATYFGETPTTSSEGAANYTNVDVKLVDIERVEVLRGPQGTAFGNAALGGVVRTIPMAPKLDRVEGKLAASYSATSGNGGDNYNFHAVGNLPLIKDKLALRATGYRYEESGFYHNRAGSDPNFQATVVAPFGAQAFASDEDEVGSTRFIGGRLAALFQASDAVKFTVSYLTHKNETDGYARATTGTYEQAMLQVAPEHVVRGQELGLYDADLDIANAKMEYDLGWADLLATYSYLQSETIYVLNWTSWGSIIPWPVSQRGGPGKHRARSGEIRLATRLDGAWNFLAGLYAEDLEDEVLFDYFWAANPATNFFGTDAFLGDYRDWRDLTQEAAFAEASWEFLPRFTLTGGVRTYNYERTNREEFRGDLFGGPGSSPTRRADASGTSLRANLSHKLNENALIYAGWSQGFRLGRPQPGVSTALCDLDNDGIVDGTNITVESTKVVNADNVDNFELGGKFELLEGRLMIASDVYRINWSEVPVLVFAPSGAEGGCGWRWTANAGSARSEGVEFQANVYVTEALRVDVGASWIRARLTNDVPALNALTGARLPGSPQSNANLSLQYEFKIRGSNAFVRADAIYVGSFYGNLQEDAGTQAGGYMKVDATARVALRHLDLDLFVRNLTDADDFTFRSGYAAGEFFGWRLRPRTVGLQLSYHFGR